MIRLVWDDVSLCFVNCHLAAGQNEFGSRNADARTILEKTRFSKCDHVSFAAREQGISILDHEYIFWQGDLNYRIDLPREEVITLIEAKKYNELAEYDQLLTFCRKDHFHPLNWFKEGTLSFAPTYKYDRGNNRFDSSNKKRSPAWCDRILYRGSMVQHSYNRFDSMISDHRPISSNFTVTLKTVTSKRNELVDMLQLFLAETSIHRMRAGWMNWLLMFGIEPSKAQTSAKTASSANEAFDLCFPKEEQK